MHCCTFTSLHMFTPLVVFHLPSCEAKSSVHSLSSFGWRKLTESQYAGLVMGPPEVPTWYQLDEGLSALVVTPLHLGFEFLPLRACTDLGAAGAYACSTAPASIQHSPHMIWALLPCFVQTKLTHCLQNDFAKKWTRDYDGALPVFTLWLPCCCFPVVPCLLSLFYNLSC